MSLFHIVGHTTFNNSCIVTLIFMVLEEVGSYWIALKGIKQLCIEVFLPSTFLKDCELALINVIKKIFLYITILLCL